MVTLWRPRFMRPRQDDRDYRIEWRDQSIRRLESLLEIQVDTINRVCHERDVLQDQLDETCRRKGLRDEENNKLRGEVDELQRKLEEEESLHRWTGSLLEETRDEVDRLTTLVYRQAAELGRMHKDCIVPSDVAGLRGEVVYLNRFIESLVGWLKEKDETILRLSQTLGRMGKRGSLD